MSKGTTKEVDSGSITQDFIQKLAEREKIAPEQVKNILINCLRSSYCQGRNSRAELEFDLSGDLLVYRKYRVVERVEDPVKELSHDNPIVEKGIKKKTVEQENFLLLPLDTRNFEWATSQEVRKKLHREIKEIQRQRQFQIFSDQQDQIFRGRITAFVHNGCKVDLNGNIGYWDREEWQESYHWKPGLEQVMYFAIKEIKKEKQFSDLPDIILTRNSELFIHRIMELEVPEIKDGTIVIRHVIRIPGRISKIVVESKKSFVDAVGTCIGQGAQRIKSIRKHVYPERVEVANWHEDKKKLFFELVAPVKVISILEYKNGEINWEVTVPIRKVSLLLDNKGKMLMSIGKFLERKIHLIIYEEIEDKGNSLTVWNGNLSPEEYQIEFQKEYYDDNDRRRG